MSAEPAMSRSRAEVDAVEFWRQFMVAFYFKDPGDVLAGALLSYRADGRGLDAVPCVRVQTREGRVYELTAHQERLKAALVDAAPVKGDRIKITYDGEAEKAAPGFNKAKLFTVEVVKPRPSQPPVQTDSSIGEVSENAPGVGRLTRNEGS